MENASGIPSALSYSLNTLGAGTSFNSFELAPSTGTSSVSPNGQIRFLLPNVGLLDMKSSKMTFSVTTTASTGARLPAHTDSLFSRLEVKAGGVSIYAGNSFHNVLENIKYNMGTKTACGVTGHKDVLDAGDHEGKYTGAAGTSESYAALGAANNLFSVDLGDMANIQPRLLMLELLPTLEIILTVADTHAIASIKQGAIGTGGTDGTGTAHASSATATFAITNPRMYVNMYSLASGAYHQAIRSRMADVGYLSLCYDNNICFNSTFTGSSRFSLSAMSLKRLTAVFRKTSATTVGGLVPIVGHAKADHDGDGAVYGIFGSSLLDKAGTAKYQVKSQQFCLPTADPAHNDSNETTALGLYDATTPCNLQFKIQSAQVPQYFAGVDQQSELTKLAYNVEKFGKAEIMPQYLANYHAFAIPLSLPESPYDKKTISGLSTQGTNAFLELTSNGANVDTAGNYDVLIFATCDQILRVGEGKQIELLN